MARPARWASTLTAAQHEAVFACNIYNASGQSRAFEGFVVHMHLAWLYLLHAEFLRDGTDYRYRSRDNPRRFVRVDGEYRRWELAKCVEERWPDPADPVRKNLEFFIALRNRIEHRHAKEDNNLALGFSGHAQAHLVNFEQELVTAFGSRASLADVLRFPLFIGRLTEDGAAALRRLRNSLPSDLRRFVAEFHSGLAEGVENDPRFELRLHVVLQQVARSPDALAIQFTRWGDMTAEQQALVEELGKRGQAVVREQKRSIVGHGLLRPHEAETRVQAALPYLFNSHHFLRAWQIKKIRPPRDDPHPERTDERYCVYDELSRQYGYTEAWVQWLIKHCSTEADFRATTGRDPVTK